MLVPRAESIPGYPMNGAEMARKHARDGRSFRAFLRKRKDQLVLDHVPHEHYRIYEDDEKRILSHRNFAAVRRSGR